MEIELTDEMEKVLDKVQKLMNLSEKAGTPEEAASAAKAQELLTAYNLDAAMLERTSGAAKGKREEAKLKGGFYHFQRDLWSAIGRLNFCLYWTQEVRRGKDEKVVINRHGRPMKTKFVHRIVGRTVNVKATQHMGQYLEAAIERLVEDAIREDGGYERLYSNFAMSFREGCVENLVGRIYARRRELLDAEAQRRADAAKAAADAAAAGVNTENALTIAEHSKNEDEANYDFLYGDGWSAQQAAARARRAEAQRKADEEYTRWAAANPEEARKREAEREKQARRWRGGSKSYSERKNQDGYAFSMGYKRAANISLDPQVGTPEQKRLA